MNNKMNWIIALAIGIILGITVTVSFYEISKVKDRPAFSSSQTVCVKTTLEDDNTKQTMTCTFGKSYLIFRYQAGKIIEAESNSEFGHGRIIITAIPPPIVNYEVIKLSSPYFSGSPNLYALPDSQAYKDLEYWSGEAHKIANR